MLAKNDLIKIRKTKEIKQVQQIVGASPVPRGRVILVETTDGCFYKACEISKSK
jgi:hypothetical protein